ncbi:MAG: pesticidal protein Cry7Aa [Saprospiraceae bacterium]|nr:pesticidal protein Cry7Aa [Saprospiraceae bacterium]
MVSVKKLGILLRKTDLAFECDGVLNPAAIKHENKIHIFYRAVAKGNCSTIGYCRLSSTMEVECRNTVPLLFPEYDWENQGLEDPRIVKIEDTFYITYTAYDGMNALGALASSKDLIHWKKHGIIVPQITYEEFKHFAQAKGMLTEKYNRFNEYPKKNDANGRKLYLWDKNLIIFPRKIKGKFYLLHRIKPDIQIVVEIEKLEDLNSDFWHENLLKFDENIVLTPRYDHEVSYIGGGCPPIETDQGWLLIYHGVHDTVKGYVYSACAALLDLENPKIEIARLPYPLFFPEKEWELKGEVNYVCFPTATIQEENDLYIYYGAADERIAVAKIKLTDLIEELMLHKI